jgi:hypothetical protein
LAGTIVTSDGVAASVMRAPYPAIRSHRDEEEEEPQAPLIGSALVAVAFAVLIWIFAS